jgi:hypothetical protein
MMLSTFPEPPTIETPACLVKILGSRNKKKQKALFRFAEDCLTNSPSGCLLFPEKEAKSVVPLRGRSFQSKASHSI